MQVEQTERVLAYLCEVFRNFNPTQETTMVWSGILPDVTAADAIRAIDAMLSEEPRQFSPTPHEIKAAIVGTWKSAAAQARLRTRAREQLQAARDAMICTAARVTDPVTLKTISILGGLGRIGNVPARDLERMFVEAWMDVAQVFEHDAKRAALKAAQTVRPLQLTGGSK